MNMDTVEFKAVADREERQLYLDWQLALLVFGMVLMCLAIWASAKISIANEQSQVDSEVVLVVDKAGESIHE